MKYSGSEICSLSLKDSKTISILFGCSDDKAKVKARLWLMLPVLLLSGHEMVISLWMEYCACAQFSDVDLLAVGKQANYDMRHHFSVELQNKLWWKCKDDSFDSQQKCFFFPPKWIVAAPPLQLFKHLHLHFVDVLSGTLDYWFPPTENIQASSPLFHVAWAPRWLAATERTHAQTWLEIMCRSLRSELKGSMEIIQASSLLFFPSAIFILIWHARLRAASLHCMEMRWLEHRSCALEVQLEIMVERLHCDVTVCPCPRLASSPLLLLTCKPDLQISSEYISQPPIC